MIVLFMDSTALQSHHLDDGPILKGLLAEFDLEFPAFTKVLPSLWGNTSLV